MSSDIAVLHDFDAPKFSYKISLYFAVIYLLYPVFMLIKKLTGRPLPRIIRRLEYLNYRNALTLAKLDRLIGVESHFGIRDCVEKKYPNIRSQLKKFGTQVHLHVHEGKNKDPNRKRYWIPTIPNTSRTWHFEKDYLRGTLKPLEPGELPVWHCDYPHYLEYYIDFLYSVTFEGLNIYKEKQP